MNVFIIAGLSGLGLVVGWAAKWGSALVRLTACRRNAEQILQEKARSVDRSRDEMLAEGHEELTELRHAAEQELAELREATTLLEEQVQHRESTVDSRGQDVESWETELANSKTNLERRRASMERLIAEILARLERICGRSREELKDQIVQSIVNEERRDIQHVIQRAEEEAERTAERESREILISAIQSLPQIRPLDTGSPSLDTPNTEAMNRLMAKEGRNIRIIESMIDVDITVEETRDGVTISSPDAIKRELAKSALNDLFKENRIHPSVIETTIKKIRRDITENMRTEANAVVKDLGVKGLRREAMETLGRLLYRYSYGQNQLYHAKEVAILAARLASHLGCDTRIARRGGLLHDVGKTVADDNRPHTEIGTDLATEWGEDERIINAIASHHDDIEHTCSESQIVKIADAISGARPGARRETIDSYIERVESLERIAGSFEGVEKVFAIYAGRELRVQVQEDRVSDERAEAMAVEIAQKIEQELTYPGQITITVIREIKASSYTR